MSQIYVPIIGFRPRYGLEFMLGFQENVHNHSDSYVFVIDKDLYGTFEDGLYKKVPGKWCSVIFIPPLALYHTKEEAEHAIELALAQINDAAS